MLLCVCYSHYSFNQHLSADHLVLIVSLLQPERKATIRYHPAPNEGEVYLDITTTRSKTNLLSRHMIKSESLQSHEHVNVTSHTFKLY